MGIQISVLSSVLDMPRASPIMIASTLALLSHEEMKPSKLVIATDNQFLLEIKEAYKTDPFVKFLSQAEPGMPTVKTMNGFWFIGERLVIPNVPRLQEALFHTAHDVLGHFGTGKSYAALRNSYYWLNMHKHLEKYYIPSCPDCQRNKSSNTNPIVE